MEMDLSKGRWINEPMSYQVNLDTITIDTEQYTDFWQRSFYGFRNDNAPAFLFNSCTDFTFTVKVSFNYQALFDQCGVIIYLNSDNWFKASIEYENSEFSRLGSVVTNEGHSDWATNDIATPCSVFYRLSQRGPDFLIEFSFDGIDYHQMRIFHLAQLGHTSEQMAKANTPIIIDESVRFGVFACSPTGPGFKATFSNCEYKASTWLAHSEN